MLASLNEVLQWAEERQCGVGAFNTPNLESIIAVLKAAEELETPVIIQHAQMHEKDVMSIEVIGPIMIAMARVARVPVCVHLDHGETVEYLERAMQMGFTSVMIDGSLLPYEENVILTSEVVEIARKYNVNVEAEIGQMTGSEIKFSNEDMHTGMYTNPYEAKRFVEDTNIDVLAASFGTVHGFYTVNPKLDFNRIEEIKKVVDKPLVMHGGSGVNPDDYRRAIKSGIRKINYFTYLSYAGVNGVCETLENQKITHYHMLVNAAMKGMYKDAYDAIKVFKG